MIEGERPLLIRVDASIQMGTGHLMRCLALAQAWQEHGGEVYFACATLTDELAHRLEAEGMAVYRLPLVAGGVEDAREIRLLAGQLGSQWVVVDGYQFDGRYQSALKAGGIRLLFVDDYGHAEHYAADLVLNQNIHASASLYQSRDPHTRLLLGPEYLMLQASFRAWRSWQPPIPPVARNVLVTLGGSDPDNITRRVVQALAQSDLAGLAGIVVIGAGYAFKEELAQVLDSSSIPLLLKQNVTDMPSVMAAVEMAISAGGSTIWELAFMGIPTLGLARAKQEVLLLEETSRRGMTITLGDAHTVPLRCISEAVARLAYDPERRRAMSQGGRAQVDGEGANRIVALMRDKGA